LCSEPSSSHKKKLGRESFVFLLILLFLTFLSGFHFSQVSFTEFFSKSGWEGAKRILFSLLNPSFKILDEVLFSAIETIYMAFMATSFAIIPASLLSFIASKNLMKSSLSLMILYTASRNFLNIIRAVEPLIWAIIFSVWVGIGPFAGMLALCLHSVASLAKLYSEQIENMEEGPMEAITSTGAHPLQVILHGVIPQVFLSFLSFTIYRWDINVRMATVIGLVGGGGIGTILMQYQGNGRWNEVGLIIIIITFIVSIMDHLSAKIRESIK
jgi:phosphonate transport system permease protein